MLLLTGPAGSGKTALVLDSLRAALRRHEAGARLLVPTATMAQHLQNLLAREGFVLRPGLIQTLSRFGETWAEDLPQISQAAFYLLVEEAARRARRPEFERVVNLPGFCAALARTLEELSSAGCDAVRLAQHLPDTALGEACLAVYREVERELERRGLALRATRLARAAARIAAAGTGGIRTFWLDGFYALPEPELAVIEAMSRHAEVNVTLPSGAVTQPTRDRLLAMGFHEQTCETRRARPSMELFAAASIEREADEIAHRILDSGRAFREIGIILRNEEACEPVLRATLERFGIPARFYFDSEVTEHGVARLLCGVVDAMLGGWDWAEALGALRLAARVVDFDFDDFDFAVRRRMPGRGLDGLRDLPDSPLLAELESLEQWRGFTLPPAEWAARMRGLRRLFRPPRPVEHATHEMAALWRSQAAVLDLCDAAVDEAARWFPESRPIPAGEFWRVVKSVMRLTPLRLPDQRSNVVHVLDVYEARQWELPLVFVCGMVEGQFPKYRPRNPFFPEGCRWLRSPAESEAEEEFLFDVAVTRATSSLVLSYPRFDARGEENLPSLFLEPLNLPPGTPAVVEPEPRHVRPSWRPPVALRSADLLERLPTAMAPTAVESFVQCPFQFFGRYTLKLEEPPSRPEERLDARVRGNIVHRVLAVWLRTREPIDAVFEREFARTAREESIPPGYQTEASREQMLADLRRFAADTQWPHRLETNAEQAFEFPVGDVVIRGRIDRLDRTPDGGAFVIDYKYSKKAQEIPKQENRLQGPLYLLAVEKALGLQPAGMFYCGLRGGVKFAGWSNRDIGLKARSFTHEWLDAAAATVLEKAAEIHSGKIAPAPADIEQCRYCTFRDVCRVGIAAEAELTEAM